MEVVNHKTGDKCFMKFEPYSYFGGVPKKVTGTITNAEGKICWVLNGTWDQKMEGSKVIGEAMVKGKAHPEIQDSKLLWKKTPIPTEAEKYYHMSRLAVELNEMEDGVCPTDSRRRPDQRLMEEGRWDEANSEKVRLEEKQREVRKRREAEQELAKQEGREYTGETHHWSFDLWVNNLHDNKLLQRASPFGSNRFLTNTKMVNSTTNISEDTGKPRRPKSGAIPLTSFRHHSREPPLSMKTVSLVLC